MVGLLALGLAAAGCGGAAGRAEQVNEIRLCRKGEMHPLNVRQVRDELRRQGFDPTLEPDEGLCSAADVIATAGSDGDDAPVFLCAVRRGPIYGVTPVLSVYREPGKAEYTIANVECTIYPHPDDDSDAGGSTRRCEHCLP